MVQVTQAVPRLKSGEIDTSDWFTQLWQYSPQHRQQLTDAYHEITLLNDDHEALQLGLEMAVILAGLSASIEAVICAMLYPLVQATPEQLPDIKAKFGKPIADMLAGVLNMQAVSALRKAEHGAQQVDRLRRMLLSMINDVRVVLVKLAERVVVMRRLKTASSAKQKVVSAEVISLYAPLANRLGIGQIKWELEDLAFRYLKPQAYHEIAQSLNEKRLDREAYLKDLLAQMQEQLTQAGINAQIDGRVKHVYSIWRKMQRKHLDFDALFDIRAIRLLVQDIATCYRALSCIHDHWQWIPAEFDDYVATPKPNGYRSIHTVIKGPEERVVEVQIRTYAMHEESEMGVAAHWRYKEGSQRDASAEARLNWLRSLLSWQQELGEGDARIEALRHKVVDSQIYVLTPGGEVVDLPAGATPVDFAYHIHTDIGHRCRGAKVDGKMVPLTTALATGQRVEIVTGKESKPSRDWLRPQSGYLTTTRARQKAQHWFRRQHRDINIPIGKEQLQKQVKKLSLQKVDYQQVAEAFNVHKVDDLYAGIATNDIRLQAVIAYLERHFSREEAVAIEEKPAEVLVSEVVTARPNKPAQQQDLVINGVDNLLFHMAGCCRPVVGDVVIGYITQGRGVSVHRQDCKTVKQFQETVPERLVEVSWGEAAKGVYPVNLKIYATTQTELLKGLSGLFANEKVPLVALKSQTLKRAAAVLVEVTVEVAGIAQCEQLLTLIRQLPQVSSVERY